VLRHFRVEEFWETGRWHTGAAETQRALEQSGTARRVLSAGQRLWVGSALVTVLNPDGEPSPNRNDDSLVLRLDWRGVSVLLTGDLGWTGETRVLERGGPVRILALRVGHHGSRFSSSPAFLEATRPVFAIISVGARNPFRHPTPETLTRLQAARARLYRTDRDGAVILETDGRQLWITRWAPGSTETFVLDPERAAESRAPPTLEDTTALGHPEAAVVVRGAAIAAPADGRAPANLPPR
jgi:competence protein ComEC